MRFSTETTGQTAEIINLFRRVFTASEGADEGDLIGQLVRDMFDTTPTTDLVVVSALDKNGALAGCIIFTPLSFENDDRTVFVLAPVAVETGRQGMGVGQALLRYGIDILRQRGTDVAVTYGDPNYYSKVGFAHVTVQDVPAPRSLNHPEGWLAQSLTDQPLTPLKGPSRCVPALDRPEYW